MVKKKNKKAREVLYSFVLAIVLMIFPVVSGIIVTVNNMDIQEKYMVQGAFMLFSILVPLCIMYITRMSMNQIGFSKVKKGSIKTILYFIPIIAAKMGYLFFEIEHSREILIALLFFTVAIGLSEEIYFRGIILRRLKMYFSIKKAILISSVLFAVVHAAQAFSGEEFVGIALTIANAFIFGIVTSEIVILTESLSLTILWHTIYNFFNWITLVDGMQEVILIILESLIMILYGIYLWEKLPEN